MTTDEGHSSNFCAGCGAPLRESDTFCTACGENRGAPQAPQQGQHYMMPPKKSNSLALVAVLSAAWAAVALILGVAILLVAESFTEQFMAMPEFLDLMEEYGYTITFDEMLSSILMFGAVVAASGVLAAVTAALALAKRLYPVALIACILSSVLGLIILVGAVGFIVVYLIYRDRGDFVRNGTAL
ncbi:MAG: zinc ribbon domain-containing protein [Methanomassiliicoccaceae archaeon]|nr:zinc ribbon domain-containing protein [Methanomassiliicoccaceae archaeon]